MDRLDMDKLNINFRELIPYAIEAFTKVYGEEYQSIISRKLHNTIILPYNIPDGIYYYERFLKDCKRNEFNLRFLKEIGMDIEKYKKETLTEKPNYDKEALKILDCYIDERYGFSNLSDEFCPLRSFSPNNPEPEENKLNTKLRLINKILGKNHEEITKETFDEFSKTEEYKKIINLINKYVKVYDKLLDEFREWGKTTEHYREYFKEESENRAAIMKKYKRELFCTILDELPVYKTSRLRREIAYIVANEDEINDILGLSDISYGSNIEEFSKKEMDTLKDPNSMSVFLKSITIKNQLNYLKRIGVVDADDHRFFNENGESKYLDSQEEIDEYLAFINQDHIKPYIPNRKLVKFVKETREKLYEAAKKEYITTRDDFNACISQFNNGKEAIDYIYNAIKDNNVCITSDGGHNSKFGFFSIMFYTVRINDGGYLSHSFLHECGHAIDQNEKGCGFEPKETFRSDGAKNKYNTENRKYERFNETLNDMFTIEANNYLKNQGIYLIEPKEFTEKDSSNRNTFAIVKDLLKPLIEKYRKQIIKAKINADSRELTRYIGEDNYEELVDAVNIVDQLVRGKDLASKLHFSKNDSTVKQYKSQVKRINKIYKNIEAYNSTLFGDEQIEIVSDKKVK